MHVFAGRPTILTGLFLIRAVIHVHCQIGFEQWSPQAAESPAFPV
jgi:hypothetical protein